MTGMAGVVSLRPQEATRDAGALVTRMVNLLRHRGPDEAGLYRAPGERAVLGACRAAASAGGGEGPVPLANASGTVWMAFDGRIYNHRALRHSLELGGQVFRSRSDAEVAVLAYQRHGFDFLDHLQGIFALAVWDERTERLILARDRIGKKPLYYLWDGQTLVFASEIKALTAAMPIRPRLCRDGLVQYLAQGFVAPPLTLFEGVSKLAPGEALVFESTGPPRQVAWWRPCRDPRKRARVRALGADEHVGNLRMLLDSSIADRLMGSEPTAAILDDSRESLIVAGAMARLAGRSVDGFSADLTGGAADAGAISAAARGMGVRHHVVPVTDRQITGFLPDQVRQMDEPIGDPDCAVTWWLAKALRDDGRAVALAGEGARPLLLSQGAAGADGPAHYAGWLAVMAERGRRLARLAFGLSPIGAGHPYWAEALLGPDLREAAVGGAAGEVPAVRSLLAEMPGWLVGNPAAARSYAVLRSRVPELLLMRLDKMGMAHGVEFRCPFLDHQLVDYALSIPPALRLGKAGGQGLLERAVADMMPALQGLPLASPAAVQANGRLAEVLGAAMAERLGQSRLFLDRILDPAFFRRLLERREGDDGWRAARLWNGLVLAEWYDVYWVIGGASADRPIAVLRSRSAAE